MPCGCGSRARRCSPGPTRRRAITSPPAWASRCPRRPRPIGAKQAIFLVDTSLSAGPQFPLWTKLLRATLENNRDSIREFAVRLLQRGDLLVAGEVRGQHAGERRRADGLCRRPGPGRGDRSGPGTQGSGLARVAEGKAGSSPPPDLFLLSDGAATWGEDRWALLAAALTARVKDRAALTPGPSPGGRGDGSSRLPQGEGKATLVRLSHGPGRRRSAVVGLSGRADGRGGLFAGGRGGDRLGLGGPSQSALAADRHRNGRRT